MDDCCAVCAEPMEWVAYGPCLHRDVCSTCVARLRFICDDRHCCICKTDCNVVFVTKALGDYTRMINDFSALPSTIREGKAGSYWYHEDTNAYFDDMDHYKMIKAMCRLSCSVCDNIEEQPHDASRRRERFRNIGQLKGHLFHRHKLHMCSLCLEGRKVFICEQKLYTRAQLNQHINTGDSLVDGSESERGGFMGHPMCEFCRTPFYGDNELYTHMSTEHYTCHICQRQHPGQYEYYKNYDDLEIHFRQQHFLCEDEACLAKKFIVFQSEGEMKIPTSFRYRHGNEQNQQRRGRARTFSRDISENQLSMAIEASLETANAEQMFHDSSTSNGGQPGFDNGNADVDSIVPPFESLATSSSEQSSRYLQALGHSSRGTPLEDSSFPPLATPSIDDQQGSKNELESSSINTMAARLRRHGNRNVSVINSGNAWPAAGRGLVQTSSIPTQSKLSTTVAPGVSANSGQVKTVVKNGASPSTYASSFQVTQRTAHGQWSAGSLQEKRDNGRTVHPTSAPNLTKSNPVEGSISEFPPISAAQVNKLPANSQSPLNVEDVHSANKSLVERIRGALDFDEDRYTLFKDISAQFRQSTIDTDTYLDYVQQFGLSHLVLEMARLCPDPQKQQELIESNNTSLQRNALQENSRVHGITSNHGKDSNISKKGKGKSVDARGINSTERLADSFLRTVHQLQSSYKPSEDNSEVLSRGDYRTNKGKLKTEQQINTNSGNQPITKLNGQGETSSHSLSSQNREDGGGGSKQRKKASKFLKVRLGDGSVSALLDRENSYTEPDPGITDGLDGDKDGSGGLPARGVWRKGGAQKLFS
ncbi:hypothetical protein TanjilG_05338 [Lupinus angustifolius]|uniref:RING-type E3 ubiquitin transferase n=1 Tax=Lupinus angustifolius TaxID=3871 RepID=A0A1J7HKY2_LUPAN|nr:hypothetical protein TanjilG_05338 [Lupinus angustifolius]